jgi:HEAT repeat protein
MRRTALLLGLVIVSRIPAQPPPEPAPALPIPVRLVVAGLIESLSDADPDVRTNAAVSLAYVGADAVEALTGTVRGPNKDARAAAAYALGEIGGQASPATEALVKALKDEDKEVRRQAAAALGRIVAGARQQPGEQRPLAPPVPIDAPPPVFPSIK